MSFTTTLLPEPLTISEFAEQQASSFRRHAEVLEAASAQKDMDVARLTEEAQRLRQDAEKFRRLADKLRAMALREAAQ